MSKIPLDLVELNKQIDAAAEKVTQLNASFSNPHDLVALTEVKKAVDELYRLVAMKNQENGGLE